jgi:hypothetical protein
MHFLRTEQEIHSKFHSSDVSYRASSAICFLQQWFTATTVDDSCPSIKDPDKGYMRDLPVLNAKPVNVTVVMDMGLHCLPLC